MALAWLDIVLVAIVLISIVVGLFRGLLFELLSVIGWFFAYFAAQWLTPGIAGHVPIGAPGSGLNHGTSFAAMFIAALLAWSLVSRFVRMLIQASPLSMTDRMLGGAFGLARGGLVLLAVATVVGLTPLVQSAAWQQSNGAAWLQSALRGLKPVLPPDISRHLPA
jgi:membrane protein required for colicin V production